MRSILNHFNQTRLLNQTTVQQRPFNIAHTIKDSFTPQFGLSGKASDTVTTDLTQHLANPKGSQSKVFDIWPIEERNDETHINGLMDGIVKNKSIPSYNFYNKEGSLIYRMIAAALPDYYVNKADQQIWTTKGNEIFETAQADMLIELGIGRGHFTRKTIIPAFVKVNPDKPKQFIGVDVSKPELEETVKTISKDRRFKDNNITVTGIAGLNHHALDKDIYPADKTKMFTIIASSIGNNTEAEFAEFLSHLKETMNKNDTFALCVDWAPKQNIKIGNQTFKVDKTEDQVRKAYNDTVTLQNAAKAMDGVAKGNKQPGTEILNQLDTAFKPYDIDLEKEHVTEAFNHNLLINFFKTYVADKNQNKLNIKEWEHNPGIEQGKNNDERYFRATSSLKYVGKTPLTLTLKNNKKVTFKTGEVLKNEHSEKYYYNELIKFLNENGFELKNDIAGKESVWLSSDKYQNDTGILLLKKKA